MNPDMYRNVSKIRSMDIARTTHYQLEEGIEFYIRPMDPFVAMTLLGDMIKVASPILGAVTTVVTGKKDAKLTDLLDADISAVFGSVAQNIDGDTLSSLVKRILNGQYISVRIEDHEPERLNAELNAMIFTGNVQDMFLLVAEVLKINYGGFTKLFDSLSGNGQGLLKSLT